jgi:hypothetical protein
MARRAASFAVLASAALLAIALAAPARAGTTPTDEVRARLVSGCKCASSARRFLRCAERIGRAALRGGAASSGSRCADDRSVAEVRTILSAACAGAPTEREARRCARAIVREAARTAPPAPPPLPPPVEVIPEPESVALGDPAFEPLPGARADFGRLGGAVYQIEIPDRWNGRLVLHMHGYQAYSPEATVAPPDLRAYLILHGYAWGASSFSSTAWIAGRSADETAALWDYFTQKYGRPCWTYATGISMGGAASHIAAERYANRFDGSLALCGSPGFLEGTRSAADTFAAGAFVAGITQEEFAEHGASLINTRILPALEDPIRHGQFEDIMLDLTGGFRAFDREGFHLEEPTNWVRTRQQVGIALASNEDRPYVLGPYSSIPSEEFDAQAIRMTPNAEIRESFSRGNETTGEVAMPLLSLYATGDGQVPMSHARALRRRVDVAGRTESLAQRVYRDPSHCGFSTEEQERSFEELVAWVEHGVKPPGHDVLVEDLRTLGGTFELAPRRGLPEADTVPGAADRAVLNGHLTLDGAPFDARFLGAIVRRADGLLAACQYTLPTVEDGSYEITVLGDAEANGCGTSGAEVLLWTFVDGRQLYAQQAAPWPGDGATAAFDGTFSTAAPEGVTSPTSDFVGEVYRQGGDRIPRGARVEAFVGRTRCGIASTRHVGNYGGFILSVVGPGSVPGCDLGAKLTFRVDGERARTTAINTPGAGRTLDLLLPPRAGDRCMAAGG